MVHFLIPLLLAFLCCIASAFTAAYSRTLGRRGGQILSMVLRDVLGLPLMGWAFVLAARRPAPRLLGASWVGDAAGALLLAAGAALIIWALAAVRWRAAAPSVGDALASTGPYARVRHPLYDGVFLELAGAAILRPTWPLLLSCLLSAGWILIQARVEEHDLLRRVCGYANYVVQVPPFLPRRGGP